MSEKETELKIFDPLDQVTEDSIDRGFFGSNKLVMQRLIDNCRMRGLIGIWTQQALSKPLTLFVQASRNTTSENVDTLLTQFASTIGFDANLVKRHFYAIYQGWEKQFLDELEKENQDADKFIDEEMAEQ